MRSGGGLVAGGQVRAPPSGSDYFAVHCSNITLGTVNGIVSLTYMEDIKYCQLNSQKQIACSSKMDPALF